MFGRVIFGTLIVGNDDDSDDIPPDTPVAIFPPVETIFPPTPCKFFTISSNALTFFHPDISSELFLIFV